MRNSPSPQQSLNDVGGAEMVRALLIYALAFAPQRHIQTCLLTSACGITVNIGLSDAQLDCLW